MKGSLRKVAQIALTPYHKIILSPIQAQNVMGTRPKLSSIDAQYDPSLSNFVHELSSSSAILRMLTSP